MSTSDLSEIVGYNTGLTKLTIYGYHGVTPAVAQLVTKHSASLVELHLEFTKEHDLNFTTVVNPILSTCPQLTQLELTTRAVAMTEYLGKYGGDYKSSCVSLHRVEFPGQPILASVTELIKFFTCVKHCTDITLHNLVNMNGTVLSTIAAHNNNPELSELTIANCALITTENLIAMLTRNSCASLRLLKF